MANSPLVSIRIPPETLARIDQLAQKLYPPRREGKTPNRSQVILDAINQFLAQHEAIPMSHEQMYDTLRIESVDHEEKEHQPPCHPESLPDYPSQVNPPTREYIDWWFNYFSYMKKFSDTWFKTK
ncbi:CopG family ribbon-helix-helix protein [Pantanalinema rosaneae CENA516]|uniref:CopG family ribbon-helix-helix protein n=1 Tax=Pantanalinema rosaneae TaxID=1620701 RepID=UPI003D6E7CFF